MSADESDVQVPKGMELRPDLARPLAQDPPQVARWSWDPETDVVTWSDELYRLLGVARADIAPSITAFLSCVHPDDRSTLGNAFGLARSSRDPFAVDHRLTSGGTVRWVRSLGEFGTATPGAPLRMHGAVHDLTEAEKPTRPLAGLDQQRDATPRTTSWAVAALDPAEGAVHQPDEAPLGGVETPCLALDPLTGLAGHGLLREYASRALARATRYGWATAVLLIDIDHFSDINAAYGHEVGDKVLVQVGARLATAFRASDVVARGEQPAGPGIGAVARLGGDQFVVVCENAAGAGVAAALAARVERVLDEPLRLAGAVDITVTAGIGMGIAGPDGPRFEQRILDAEAALASAKHRGRRQCEVADGPAAGRHRQLEAEQALRRALDLGELRLHYQPKMSFESGRITGAEALLRWQDPERGLVAPSDFIPLAEETGLIIPIGRWVIEEGCRQVAAWNRQFPRQPPLVMAVNVSVDQIGPELIDTVVHALASAGARPGDLCLEVTESILIGDSDAPVATLDGLAALGVRLSMDDFGTGYSSLSHLQRFPLDELKIDKSFIDGVDDGGNDTAIVAATVAMAHALGLAVVAEGVERPEQFERLRVLGCQEVQGYLISRPQPAEAVTQLLADDGWGQWRTAARAGETIPASAADRPARILVVDDARDVRQLARMAMTAAGFDVDDVACGRGALRAARETRPDCVVLDVAMPDMSGFEVCRALRAAPATAGCTIVMLSSHTGAHDKIDAFSCGADDYIVKPFAPRDLVGRVRAAMKVRNDGGCGSGLTRGNPS